MSETTEQQTPGLPTLSRVERWFRNAHCDMTDLTQKLAAQVGRPYDAALKQDEKFMHQVQKQWMAQEDNERWYAVRWNIALRVYRHLVGTYIAPLHEKLCAAQEMVAVQQTMIRQAGQTVDGLAQEWTAVTQQLRATETERETLAQALQQAQQERDTLNETLTKRANENRLLRQKWQTFIELCRVKQDPRTQRAIDRAIPNGAESLDALDETHLKRLAKLYVG